MMLDTVFIPAPEKNSRRLMIVLHGLGDSVAGYEWMPHAMQLPWMNYLLVNAPDEYYGGWSWFDIDDKTPGVLRSRKLLTDLLDSLRAKDFPADQITLGGFSQGCLMTIDVGLRYPHKLAGLVGISGWVFELENLLSEVPATAKMQRLLSTHGPFDTVIPITGVREQIKMLKVAGFNTAWHEFPKAHTIYGEEELSVIREFVRAGYAVVGK
jgi:phospholipase/carboxylesterase